MYIFWQSMRKARKERFCDHCCTQIHPGDIYERYAWVPQRGRFFIMNRHSRPGCPEDAYGVTHQEEPVGLAAAFGYQMVFKAVQALRLDGTVETRFEPEFVLTGETEPEPPRDEEDWLDDDIPF